MLLTIIMWSYIVIGKVAVSPVLTVYQVCSVLKKSGMLHLFVRSNYLFWTSSSSALRYINLEFPHNIPLRVQSQVSQSVPVNYLCSTRWKHFYWWCPRYYTRLGNTIRDMDTPFPVRSSCVEPLQYCFTISSLSLCSHTYVPVRGQ